MAHKAGSGHALPLYQWLAFGVGVVYLTIGVAGFFMASPAGFAGRFTNQEPFGSATGPVFNVIHLATGFLGVLLWSAPGGARAFGWVTALGYGAVFLYGVTLLDSQGVGVIGRASSWLHVLSVAAGLAVAVWPDRRGDVRSSEPRTAG